MLRPRPVIEFLCRPEDKGLIAEPVPARGVLPAWFRHLPGVDESEVSATNNGLTVKRCLPFVDAMSAGWVIPLATPVRLEISEGGQTVTAGWEFDRELVSNHGAFQIAGSPYEPHPPMNSTTTGRSSRRKAGALSSPRRSIGPTVSSKC